MLFRRRSRNDAGFLEAEIALSFWCRGSNDDGINQLELENSVGFENSSGQSSFLQFFEMLSGSCFQTHSQGLLAFNEKPVSYIARISVHTGHNSCLIDEEELRALSRACACA